MRGKVKKIKMLENTPAFETASSHPWIVTDNITPAEPNNVPSSLVNLVGTAYNDIMSHLERGEMFKRRGITTRPAIYLCNLDELRRFRDLIGNYPQDAETYAMYNNLAHAIYLPANEVVNSLSAGDDHARQLVYEEMIHALTSYYDPVTRVSQHGFRRNHIEFEDSHQRRIKVRSPRETWEFYDWHLVSQITEEDINHRVIDENEYQQNPASTENTTSLIRYLLTMPDDIEIAAIDFSIRPPKAIAIATRGDLIEIYKEISGGGKLTSELLDILASGEELTLQRLVGLASIRNLKPAGIKGLKEKVLVKSPKLYSFRRILDSLTKTEYGIEVVKPEDFSR